MRYFYAEIVSTLLDDLRIIYYGRNNHQIIKNTPLEQYHPNDLHRSSITGMLGSWTSTPENLMSESTILYTNWNVRMIQSYQNQIKLKSNQIQLENRLDSIEYLLTPFGLYLTSFSHSLDSIKQVSRIVGLY